VATEPRCHARGIGLSAVTAAIHLSPVHPPDVLLPFPVVALFYVGRAAAGTSFLSGSTLAITLISSTPMEPWYAPSVLVQIGLLVIGFFYTLFARRQWQAIREQTRLIEESLIADKRAFVCADLVLYLWELDSVTGLYNFRLRPRYRNTGSTPTKDLRSHVECDIRNSWLPPGYIFTDQNATVGTGMIPPNGESTGGMAPQNAPITPQDIVETQGFKRFIYLWGWIKYHDVFPNTPEHTTRFCWLVLITGDPMTFVPNTPGQPPTPGILSFSFFQHTEGNYAD
jgi:hypothetical protein